VTPPARRRSLIRAGLAAAALLIPVGFYFLLPHVRPRGAPPALLLPEATTFPASALPLAPVAFGAAGSPQSKITHVQIADLDRDGRADILACDAQRGRVLWYRPAPGGTWSEAALGDADLAAPCHVAVADLNGDGHSDLVVAGLGSVWPTDEKVGRVYALLNDGKQVFTTRVLADDLRRVADVQAGDLDGDGDPDLVVAEFGYDRGAVRWLENRGRLAFREHLLYASPGCIHVPLLDLDGDGDLDVVALMSQEDEEVIAFDNQGGGRFGPRRVLLGMANIDHGSSGLFVTDLNRDGRPDLLLTNGDNLEIEYPAPQPWHGCLWLENVGGGKFAFRRIATVAGVYAAAAGDLDGDGDTDVVLACMFNDWRRSGTAALVWLENDGRENFTTRQIADRPSHLATVACGDLNGDGRADVVAGSLPLMEPFDRVGRLTLWLSQKEGP
jgi:hypothetical protein